MHATHSAQHTARLVLVRGTEVVEVLGPTIEFLTAPETDDASPCIMRGTVPSGVFVPLHSHADPETCILVSGKLDALTHSDAGFEWVRLKKPMFSMCRPTPSTRSATFRWRRPP